MRSRFALRAMLGLALAVSAAAAAACGNITTPIPSSSASGTAGTGSGAAPGATGTATSGTSSLPTGSQYASDYRAGASATITAGTPLPVAMSDFAFTPNTLTVAKGTVVTIKLTNTSPIPHTFTLDAWNVNVVVNPGTTATASFTPNQSGTYYFYCAQPGHAAQHMVGKLIVA